MRPRLGATYPFVKCGSRRQCLSSVVSRQPFPGQHNVAISSYPNLQASVFLGLSGGGSSMLVSAPWLALGKTRAPGAESVILFKAIRERDPFPPNVPRG